MPCYHPITALQPTAGGPLIFPQPGHLYLYNDYRTLTIGCRQCHGCKMKDARQWAMRCVHEKQMHKYSCYITLTYNDKHLPTDLSLRYEDYQVFMKRLLKSLGRKGSKNILCETYLPPTGGRRHGAAPHTPGLKAAREINRATRKTARFYMAGEYGELYSRPHYHALLFGVDFSDRVYHKTMPSGSKVYKSDTLDNLWKKGYTSVGDITYQSAAYVARYVMKKRTGDGTTVTEIIDPETGEIYKREKEFNEMSRNPGLAKPWFERYQSDVYTTGKVVVQGKPQYPPRYYDKLYKKIDQAALEDFQYQRYLEQAAQNEHHTPERLAVQELVAIEKTRNLKRNLDGRKV